MQLLHRCIANEGEYSLNIFIKQCEILIDKHDKMHRLTPSDNRIDEPKASREDKIKNSKSCLTINKGLRRELLSSYHDQAVSRQSERRLKGSKSLINLKVNKPGPSSKSRNLKNGGGIFSKSKEKLLDKTNLFQQSWGSFTKSKSNGSSFIVNQPSSLGRMAGSASSNWFNQSMSSNQSIIKLRNFKKSNHYTGIASHTPSHHQFQSQASATVGSNA